MKHYSLLLAILLVVAVCGCTPCGSWWSGSSRTIAVATRSPMASSRSRARARRVSTARPSVRQAAASSASTLCGSRSTRSANSGSPSTGKSPSAATTDPARSREPLDAMAARTCRNRWLVCRIASRAPATKVWRSSRIMSMRVTMTLANSHRRRGRVRATSRRRPRTPLSMRR